MKQWAPINENGTQWELRDNFVALEPLARVVKVHARRFAGISKTTRPNRFFIRETMQQAATCAREAAEGHL